MNRTVFISLLLASTLAVGLVSAAQVPSQGLFGDIWTQIQELQDQAAELLEETASLSAQIEGLQVQIDSIDTGADSGGDGPQTMAYDAFMTIEGDSIALAGYVFSINPRDHGEFKVVKLLDKSSPKLSLYACEGRHIEEVTLNVAGLNGTMKYIMTDVLVKEIDKSSPLLASLVRVKDVSSPLIASTGSGGGTVYEPLPMEEVSFRYGKIRWEYEYTTGGGGMISAGWNSVTDEPLPLEEVAFV
jgi:type VI protein secretion system component Hcp